MKWATKMKKIKKTKQMRAITLTHSSQVFIFVCSLLCWSLCQCCRLVRGSKCLGRKLGGLRGVGWTTWLVVTVGSLPKPCYFRKAMLKSVLLEVEPLRCETEVVYATWMHRNNTVGVVEHFWNFLIPNYRYARAQNYIFTCDTIPIFQP